MYLRDRLGSHFAMSVIAVLLGLLPAMAATHGGVEIGAKGIKATVVETRETAEGMDIKVLLNESVNVSLVTSLAARGSFDPAALSAAASAVTRFTSRMKTEFKLPAERIHVVASSGVFVPLEGKPDKLSASRKELADAVRQASSFTLSFVDLQREAELSIRGIVPTRHAATSLLLDIGSGNTKGGCIEPSKKYLTGGIPFGSASFAELVEKQRKDGPFAEAAARSRDEVLVPGLRKIVEAHPAMLKRERVYLSGGAIWALATLRRPTEQTAYVTLSVKDIEDYRRMLVAAKGDFPSVDLSNIKDEQTRKAAQKEIDKVKAAFKPQQLLAGAEIMTALASEFNFVKDKQLVFARHSQIGWLLAYIAEKDERKD